MVGSGTNIVFVPDVGSFVHICLESETYVCSFSFEFLFSFELLNLYVFSILYTLFLPFCSSRSAPPFPLFPEARKALSFFSFFFSTIRAFLGSLTWSKTLENVYTCWNLRPLGRRRGWDPGLAQRLYGAPWNTIRKLDV